MKKKGNKEVGVIKISWMKKQNRATNTKSVSNRIYKVYYINIYKSIFIFKIKYYVWKGVFLWRKYVVI